MRFNHVTIIVADLGRSKAFYRTLGLIQIVDTPPRYARFVCPDGDATLSVEVTGEAITTTSGRPHLYFECARLDETAAELKSRGLAFEQEPTDMFYGWREAWLRDPDGHDVRLYRETIDDVRLNPPWKLQSEAAG